METKPLVVERVINASADRVWRAITDKDQIRQWNFDIKEFRAEPGFEFEFSAGASPTKPYLHLCKVTEVIPGKKMTYSWKYAGYPGESFVTFELFPEGDRTRLKLTHRGLETFPSGNPDFAAGNFNMGWNSILDMVKTSVEKVMV